MTPEERAREITHSQGMRCLIPVGKQGFTCHEHTLCDCETERLIAIIIREVRNEALERAAFEAGNPGIVSPKQAELLRTRILALKDKPE